MKKFIYFIAIAVIAFCSCTKMETNSMPEVEYIEVPIKTLINNVEFSDERFLTKSTFSSNDLWGIQVVQNWEDLDMSNYCRGIFSDISLLKSIKLVKGVKYHIAVNYLPNGKELCPKYGEWAPGVGAGPFCIDAAWGVNYKMPIDTLIYDQDVFLGIGQEAIELHDCEYYLYTVDDYYVQENVPLEINLVKMNAGLTFKFIAENGYNYDKVYVSSPNSYWDKVIEIKDGYGEYEIPSITTWIWGREEESIIFAFGDKDNPSLFWNGSISIKKGTIRTYTVKLKPQGTNTGINFILPTEDSANEDMGALN